MGSATSHINPSEIKIDNRFNDNNTGENKYIGANKTVQDYLVSEKTQPRITLSINSDNTIRIAASKSCATQTADELENENGNKCSVMDQVTENGIAPIETKHNKEIQTNPNEPTEDYSTAIRKEEEPPQVLPYTETDNDVEYSTDIGSKTDGDFETEMPKQTIAWEEQSVIALREGVKQNSEEEEKEIDTQADNVELTSDNDDDDDDSNEPRPFEDVTLKKYGKYKIRMSDDQKNCIASSAAFLDTGDAVIIDRSNQKIKFVDRKFQFISAHELSAKPWAVCSRGTDVFVTMGNTQIQHLVVDEMIIEPINVFEVKGRCLGVCVFEEYLAVGLQIGEISLLDFKGIHKDSIKLPVINSKVCNPWHLCATFENNILVTDSDTGSIYCVNKKSELIFQYHGVDTPRGTALDNEGNIIVVGRDKASGAVVTLLHRDMELQNMLHIEEKNKTEIESRTLMTWEQLEFVPYTVCYRKDRIIVFGGIQETLKIMKLR